MLFRNKNKVTNKQNKGKFGQKPWKKRTRRGETRLDGTQRDETRQPLLHQLAEEQGANLDWNFSRNRLSTSF